MTTENLIGAAQVDDHAAFTPIFPNPSAVELSRYLPELNELDLSDDQKRELLATLWSIMFSFVEMGFGVDICGLILNDFNDASSSDSVRVILDPTPNLETPSDGTESQ